MFYQEGERLGGVDESGVSDIAGPLIAACVILPRIDMQRDDLRIFNVDDCKKIPEKYRKQHAEVILQTATAFGIGEVSPAEVDYLGKPNASRLAMMRSILACKTVARSKPMRPDFLIVDGENPVQVSIRQRVVQDGDQKSLCVAAASIIAKVYRDDIMAELHKRYPQYDWISNKGYPCENHFRGMDRHGIQIGIHRIRFWPFTPSTMRAEDDPGAIVRWDRRRKKWRQATEQTLGQELGEQLWTSKPPLWKPSVSSKASPLQGVTTTRSSSAKRPPSTEKPMSGGSL
jgi:ribonuclease HII